MVRFVLVHGAWLGGWCFEPLVRELESRGHRVDRPDLPCDDVSKTPLDYAEAVGPCDDAVLVAHSLGGLTTALIGARQHVYIAGLLPIPNVYGEALAEDFGGTKRDELDRSYWPDERTAAARLFPDCTRAQVTWAFPRLRRQAPVAPAGGDIRGVYVACLRDVAVRPAWQLATAELGLQVVELDAGHFPFITDPAGTAHVLERAL